MFYQEKKMGVFIRRRRWVFLSGEEGGCFYREKKVDVFIRRRRWVFLFGEKGGCLYQERQKSSFPLLISRRSCENETPPPSPFYQEMDVAPAVLIRKRSLGE